MRRAGRNYAVDRIQPTGHSLVTPGLDSQPDGTVHKPMETDAASNPLAWI